MFWLITIVIMLVFYCFLSQQLYKNLLAMEKSADAAEIIENGTEVLREHPDFREARRWAEANGFEAWGMIDLFGPAGRMTMAMWEDARTTCTLTSYEVPKLKRHAFELATPLGEKELLSTVNMDFGNMYPHSPGIFVQAFHGSDLNQLQEMHDAAQRYLATNRELHPVPRREPMEVGLQTSIRRHATFLRSLPLARLRCGYWYCVRRPWMNNRSIARQYPAGG